MCYISTRLQLSEEFTTNYIKNVRNLQNCCTISLTLKHIRNKSRRKIIYQDQIHRAYKQQTFHSDLSNVEGVNIQDSFNRLGGQRPMNSKTGNNLRENFVRFFLFCAGKPFPATSKCK